MIENFDRKYIGEEIKKARKNKKLSQFELAELTGLDEKQIYRIESGITSPKLENFIKIADMLEITIKHFSNPNITQKPYGNEILEILNLSSEDKMKIYYNVLKSLQENL